MTPPDLSGQCALITGGTRGLGRAIGLALGKCGTTSWLTHRWGSAEPSEVHAEFEAANAEQPVVIEADVGNDDDTERLLSAIKERHGAVDIFVSNACVVGRGGSMERLKERDLLRCLQYSAWPLRRYLESMQMTLGRLPKYVVVTSSDGVENHYPDYDYVALSKAALEAEARAVVEQTRGTSTRVFVLRTRFSTTTGFGEVFPSASRDVLDRFARFGVAPTEAGLAVMAIASGLLDGLHGQILCLDRGTSPMDNTLTVGPWLAEAS